MVVVTLMMKRRRIEFHIYVLSYNNSRGSPSVALMGAPLRPLFYVFLFLTYSIFERISILQTVCSKVSRGKTQGKLLPLIISSYFKVKILNSRVDDKRTDFFWGKT